MESNPPKPEDIEVSMRGNKEQYTEFTDRMIRAVHGKSRYGDTASNTKLCDFVSTSQEAFAMLLYKNGYKIWVNNYDVEGSSEASESTEVSAGYLYTARSSELTSRNGGWHPSGMQKFEHLYKIVQADRIADKGVFDLVYMEHWKALTKDKKKRKRDSSGQFKSVAVSDDLADLLSALDGDGDETSGSQQLEEV